MTPFLKVNPRGSDGLKTSVVPASVQFTLTDGPPT